jgi:hypothetical protein
LKSERGRLKRPFKVGNSGSSRRNWRMRRRPQQPERKMKDVLYFDIEDKDELINIGAKF